MLVKPAAADTLTNRRPFVILVAFILDDDPDPVVVPPPRERHPPRFGNPLYAAPPQRLCQASAPRLPSKPPSNVEKFIIREAFLSCTTLSIHN